MKKILIALSVGLVCAIVLGSSFQKTETALASGMIRLHVIANSDSAEDQALKLKVRDAVIEKSGHLFAGNGDICTARKSVEDNIREIEQYAQNVVCENGFDYPVKVSLGMSDFPTKEYGELILPAGSYEAVKIEIGKASGRNWWCVLFPPLCFVDQTCPTASRQTLSMLDDTLPSDANKLIKKEKSPSVELRFKIYELWQNAKHLEVFRVLRKN